MIEENRMTGKTTRLALQVSHALCAGKTVLVVAHNEQMAIYLADKIDEILKTACNYQHVARRQRTLLEFRYGGKVLTSSRMGLSRLRGTSYDEFYSDVSDLTNDELMLILPTIRAQATDDKADTSQADVEIDEHDPYSWLRKYGFQLTDDPVEDEPVKDTTNARRTLSSR